MCGPGFWLISSILCVSQGRRKVGHHWSDGPRTGPGSGVWGWRWGCRVPRPVASGGRQAATAPGITPTFGSRGKGWLGGGQLSASAFLSGKESVCWHPPRSLWLEWDRKGIWEGLDGAGRLRSGLVRSGPVAAAPRPSGASFPGLGSGGDLAPGVSGGPLGTAWPQAAPAGRAAWGLSAEASPH